MGDFVYLSHFLSVIIVIDSFTLDSAVNIPLFVMGMMMVFCLTYEGGFCKGLVYLSASISDRNLAYRVSSSTSPG